MKYKETILFAFSTALIALGIFLLLDLILPSIMHGTIARLIISGTLLAISLYILLQKPNDKINPLSDNHLDHWD